MIVVLRVGSSRIFLDATITVFRRRIIEDKNGPTLERTNKHRNRTIFGPDTFTGDGSTTTFDMTNTDPDGGGNDIQVFVDNVRQQEGSSNVYTLGQDGSGDFKRITFTSSELRVKQYLF